MSDLMLGFAAGKICPEHDGIKSICHALAFRPDGTQLIAAVGSRVLMYDAADGDLLHSLKGHKDAVYCVVYSRDGKRFASGGADRTIIIWTHKAEGILKYSHGDSVQCLSYNPVTQQLASGSASDFGIWSPEQKSVAKHRVSSKVLCCAWTGDGQHLALGMYSGQISICNKSGVEQWNITQNKSSGYLAVGCWDGTLSFYDISGKQIGKDKDVGFDPCCLSYHDGKYVCVGGSDRKFYGRKCQGIQVHGLYQERYAFRDAMTDVVIQHLISDEKIRIKCWDYIKKIAVYQERVAVQLSNRIIVYELSKEKSPKSQYWLCAKINQVLECNLLVLTSNHITLCQVCGGPSGGEGLLVGMKNGLIVKIWINSNFPVRLYKHTSGIRCLDLSAKRTCLAIVDESASVIVYDLQTKEVTFDEKFASSVAWNTEMEAMLCYSGSGKLNIKTADFPVHRQKLQGYVVGFQGSKIFCLHHLAMQTIEVPQSTSMRHYVQKKQYEDAYRVACLGVTELDWRMLATKALIGQAWEVARAGFIRIRDVRFLELIHKLQKLNQSQMPCLDAIVLAYQGKYDEAAKAYVEAGQVERAMEMYSDLRMFDKAKALAEDNEHISEVVGKASVQEIIERQAQWTEETQDHETAADMYIAAAQLDKALAILAEHGPASKLIEVARRLKKTDTKELKLCASLMRKGGQTAHALETYIKLGDFRSILSLHVELEQWDDAFAMETLHPELQGMVSLPYAEWLVQNDRFEEARVSYRQAERPDLSEALLKKLIENAVKERRFKAAAHTCWSLAVEIMEGVVKGARDDPRGGQGKRILDSYVFIERAEIYYAYSFIHQFRSDPFRTSTPESLFHIARFLVARIRTQPPDGVSLVNILMTLAKQAEELGCYKVARHAYGLLQGYRIPTTWVKKVEIATMRARGRAGSQHDGHLSMDNPFCYCCSSPFPLTSSASEDACNICSQPVFRSFLTFEQLPVVEFVLEDGISHEEALQLLAAKQTTRHTSFDGFEGQPTFVPGATKKTVFGDMAEMATLLGQGLMRISKATLSKIPKSQVIVQKFNLGLPQPRYFLVVDSEYNVTQCPSCSHFFEEEEWDLFHLQEEVCPFCQGSPAAPCAAELAGAIYSNESTLSRTVHSHDSASNDTTRSKTDPQDEGWNTPSTCTSVRAQSGSCMPAAGNGNSVPSKNCDAIGKRLANKKSQLKSTNGDLSGGPPKQTDDASTLHTRLTKTTVAKSSNHHSPGVHEVQEEEQLLRRLGKH
ncbi:hypothetical protein AXG93_3873s1360 [Marchantia polymorpha subsp. ruderalis]|uniref:Intraflagellar transport protein 122 homolog n=3 Tax=Marchantia polymorpha TaxID=3197 RepID=A0A176VHY9_MARPO|nr:hypothetical protein AXG93_3873s1360 [Marchantia polymorpha subsp. ruderalis]